MRQRRWIGTLAVVFAATGATYCGGQSGEHSPSAETGADQTSGGPDAGSSLDTFRIAAGNSGSSEVIRRMNLRDRGQMPPLGTEQVDAAGVATVRAWIDAL